jgi:hypothetical protein
MDCLNSDKMNVFELGVIIKNCRYFLTSEQGTKICSRLCRNQLSLVITIKVCVSGIWYNSNWIYMSRSFVAGVVATAILPEMVRWMDPLPSHGVCNNIFP